MREWFFLIDDFLQFFAQSIDNIINNLPEDQTKRKEMEIELAYIIHDLYINQEIIIARDTELGNIRSVELVLDREGLLSQYLAFAHGTQKNIDISEPKYFLQFLDYLASYIPNGIHDVRLYLRACIGVSQLGNEGMSILLQHTKKMFSYISMDDIDVMIDNYNWYIGKESVDVNERIRFIMEEENITHDEAIILFRDFQEDCAGFHLYLVGLYNAYIEPKLCTVPIKEQQIINSMLNDFHEIVDPEYFIPLFFQNGNGIETLEREKIIAEWREIH